jgi:hypothetical protein
VLAAFVPSDAVDETAGRRRSRQWVTVLRRGEDTTVTYERAR